MPTNVRSHDFAPAPDHPGWLVGPEVAETTGPPPTSPVAGMLSLYGMAPGDWDYRLYLVPQNIHLAEIVEGFEVGSRGALRHGWHERDTIDLVAEQLTGVDAVVPGSIERADPGSLRFRFWRRLTQQELDQIEDLYRKVDPLQAGLEGYADGTTGGSLLDEMREAACLKLWWA